MNIRVHVKNELESKVVQKRAFGLGYGWHGYDRNIQHDHQPYLFIDNSDRTITYTDFDFHRKNFEEISFYTFVSRYIDRLPEKWAVNPKNESEGKIVREWFSKNYKHYNPGNEDDFYWHFPAYDGSNYCHVRLQAGYEEITFEQFQIFVLPSKSEQFFTEEETYEHIGVRPDPTDDFGVNPDMKVEKGQTYNFTVGRQDKTFLFSNLLSLSFTDLISLRNYYQEILEANKADLRVLYTKAKRSPDEVNKDSLSKAESLNKEIYGELKEVNLAIQSFINRLKK